MKTSYFAKYNGKKGISIALKAPPYFKGESYEDLFPKWWFLKQYKENHDENTFIMCYYIEVLEKLNPQKVYDDLSDKIILCWEKSGTFCHRRVVAEWLQQTLGVYIPEL